MRRSLRATVTLALAAGLFGLACGSDSSGPVVPKTVAAVAGDSQSAVVGTTLPIPLSALVTGSESQPFRNVEVTWAVTEGAATLGAVASSTDSEGIARTTLTLGNTEGRVTVRATVTGLPAATFTATACVFPVLTLGATVSGALAVTDCKLGPFFEDFYSLDLTSGGGGGQQGITLSMSSTTFDTWLELYTDSRAFVALNDDIDPGVVQNSLLNAIVAPGHYVVAPSSYDADTTGDYSVSAAAWSPTVAGCEDVWVTRGVTLADSVTTTDCSYGTGPSYADLVLIAADSGSVLKIAMRSGAFNAALFLLDPNGLLVGSNDDSAGVGPHAYLVATVPATNFYVLLIATSVAGATGAYTLDIAASSTLAASEPLLPGPFPGVRGQPFRFAKPGPLPPRRWLR